MSNSLVILSLFFSINAYGNEFLRGSNILEDIKVKAYASEFGENGIVLSDTFKDLKDEKMFHVTKRGFRSVVKKTGQGFIQGCGEKIKGKAYKVNPKNGLVLVYNPPPELKMKWVSGSDIHLFTAPRCLKDLYKYEGLQVSYHKLSKSKETFYISSWATKGTEDEANKNCMFYKKEDEKAACVVRELKRPRLHKEIGFYTPGKTCKKFPIFSKLSDEEGQNGPVGNIKSLYGLIEIKFKKQKEEWIIFESPGYEGKGMVAFPLGQFLKGKTKTNDWLVYSGC